MRAALLLVAAMIAADASPAHTVPVLIYLSADSGGGGCLVADQQPGAITVYILHWNAPGVTGSQFRVATGGGFTGVFVSATPAGGFLGLGQIPEDYAMSYGGCQSGTFLVATLQYQGFGTSSACSHMSIEPSPTSPIPGEVAVVDCGFNLVPGTSPGPAVVNYDGACLAWCVGAVETSTWGRIKAMYR